MPPEKPVIPLLSRMWYICFEEYSAVKTIDQALIREITERLVTEFQPEQVILFGSHAWGEPDQYSDVDVMVLVTDSEESDYERTLRGRRCLRDLDSPKDLLVRTRAEFDFFRDVKSSLEHRIFERGKILYERSETSACANLDDKSAASSDL